MTAMPRYAVFGHPIAHSLSPRLHALFAEQTGVALEYGTIDAAPAEFEREVRGFFAHGGYGANVTLPYKAAAFALANAHTHVAQRLGVANVLTRRADGRLEADSNDGAGMLADLRDRYGVDPAGCTVLLLGAGGAARAAAFALLDAGARNLTLANRTPTRARALAVALSEPERVSTVAWHALDCGATFDLVINATSAGVGHAKLELPVSLVASETVAYDLSYGPAAQSFLDWAQAAGCAAAFDGLGMLVETAAASFERWHDVQPNAGAALQVLRDLVHPPAASPRPPSFRRG